MAARESARLARVRPGRPAPIGVEAMTVSIATLGFPRIGPRRELKFALESFWAGKTSEAELREAAAGLRAAAWARQHALGADHIPSGDFSLYDHVLDTSAMLGAVPARYGSGRGSCRDRSRSGPWAGSRWPSRPRCP